MTEIRIRIERGRVWEEVAKTTEWDGVKGGDVTRREKVATQVADQQMLERFWDETCSVVSGALKQFLSGESRGECYTATLEMSSAFDRTLIPAIRQGVFSFFVESVISRWLLFSDKAEGEQYALKAAATLEDVLQKVYHKRKPTRPRYDD